MSADRSDPDAVHAEYNLADAAGIEVLAQACTSLDRAEALASEIAKDGAVIRANGLIKDHPGLKHELAARAFCVRSLHLLGLNFEPIRTPGRPVGDIAI
jgi:hypothetical protein